MTKYIVISITLIVMYRCDTLLHSVVMQLLFTESHAYLSSCAHFSSSYSHQSIITQTLYEVQIANFSKNRKVYKDGYVK